MNEKEPRHHLGPRLPLLHPLIRGGALAVSYQVDNPTVSRDGRFLGQRGVELARSRSLEVVDPIVVEVHAVLDDGEVAKVLTHLAARVDFARVAEVPIGVRDREAELLDSHSHGRGRWFDPSIAHS